MARSLTTQHQENLEKVSGIFEQEKFVAAVEAGLPANIIGPERQVLAQRVIRSTYNQIRNNPLLMECSPRSLANAAIDAAELKLELDDVTGQGHIVRYWNSAIERYEAQLQIGYKGMLELARRSKEIKNILAKVVCENDTFETVECPPDLKHQIVDRHNRGPRKVVYAWAMLNNGEQQFEAWTWDEILHHRDQHAKKPKYGTWVWETHPDAMARKTMVVQLCKYLPVSVECQRAAARDEYADQGLLKPALQQAKPTPQFDNDPLDGSEDTHSPTAVAARQQVQEVQANPPEPKSQIKLGPAKWGTGQTPFAAAMDALQKVSKPDELAIAVQYVKGHQDITEDQQLEFNLAKEQKIDDMLSEDAKREQAATMEAPAEKPALPF